jgi:hypothetical protein
MEDTKQEVEHLDEHSRSNQYTTRETKKVVLMLDVSQHRFLDVATI